MCFEQGKCIISPIASGDACDDSIFKDFHRVFWAKSGVCDSTSYLLRTQITFNIEQQSDRHVWH